MSPAVGLAPAPQSAPVPAAHAVVSRANPAPYGWVSYVVRPGDTLSEIGLRTRATTGALVARNNLRGGGHFLRIGERLWVPRTTPQRAAASHRAAPVVRSYRVQPGDTIGGIALRHRVSEAALLRLNKLDRRGLIYAGQTIRVPGAAVSAARSAARRAATPAVRMTRVTVRTGDTIGAIALRLRVSEAAILKANRIGNPRLLQVGHVLNVPVKAWSRSSPAAYSSNTFAGRTYAGAVVSAAARNRAHLARVAVPSRAQTRALIVSTARRHGVDPRLALAVAWQESGWNQRQVSVANAIGTMQVIPSSGEWASQMAGRRLDLLTTRDNITAGVVILRSLLRSARTPAEAIAGYYQGLASVQSRGMYADTKGYVRAVLAHRARF
jgi:LysM repeat protein